MGMKSIKGKTCNSLEDDTVSPLRGQRHGYAILLIAAQNSQRPKTTSNTTLSSGLAWTSRVFYNRLPL